MRVWRYQCQRCDAILVVGPRGIERHKRYSGPAIAFALALWALASRPEPEVFERVSVFEFSPDVIAHGWRSLRRWTRDATLGALWPRLRARAAAVPADGTTGVLCPAHVLKTATPTPSLRALVNEAAS